jgi:hypothetical protein
MFETNVIYYHHNVNQELDHPNNYINQTILSRKKYIKKQLIYWQCIISFGNGLIGTNKSGILGALSERPFLTNDG